MNNYEQNIVVIGMGYVGIPIAVLLANAGYRVFGIQRRSIRSGWKIDWLNQGRCTIGGNEPELPQMLEKVVKNGSFSVSDDYSVIKSASIVLIDVQTPTDQNHIPQYDSLKEACHSLGRYLAPGKTVIIESTVAPGTTNYLVKPILESESGLKAGLPGGFGLCFSYERVMVGRLIHNIREYPKIIGGIDQLSLEIARRLYSSVVTGGVHLTDPLTAEVSKTVENAYRDVQIAFANEVALLCESLGIDVYDVRNFVNGLPDDPSVPYANPVRNMHFPGAGVGGHCLPKDTWLLMHGYNQYANLKRPYPSSLLTDARKLNDWMPVHVVDLLESALSTLQRDLPKQIEGKNEADRGRLSTLDSKIVCILGFAFLENSDDFRNTPSVPLIEELIRRGASCRIHDPFIKSVEKYPFEPDLTKALKSADAVILMTKHDAYRSLNPQYLSGLLKTRVIIDGRNMFDPEEFLAAGFIYRGIGKGNINQISGV